MTFSTGNHFPGLFKKTLQAALLLLWALAAVILLSPRGGLRAVYSVETGAGALVPLFARTDPEVNFPAPEVLAQPFFQHWNLRTLGVPSSIPPFQVRWTGKLHCPVGGHYRFHVGATGRVRLLLDGRPLFPEDGKEEEGLPLDLSPGWHDIDLTFQRGDEKPMVRLLWEVPGTGVTALVPRSALTPSVESRKAGLLAAGAGLVLAAAWVLFAVWLWKRRRDAGSLGEFIMAHRHGAALGVILITGMALRLHQYDLIPFHHETADEYQHGWEGWTLLHEGAPRAWTFYPWVYTGKDRVFFFWFGDPYNLVLPYFDHPPGFSLLVGGVSTLLGAEQMLDCTLWRMRLVPIALGLLTLCLVARVGWSLFAEPLAGTLAALVYATVPTIVMGSRLVKAESLIAPLLLVQVLWLERYLREGRRGDLLRMAAGGFGAIWAKATGIAVPAAALAVLAVSRRWKAMAWVGGAAAAAVAAYLLYGACYGWGTFLAILELQSSKVVAVRSLLELAGISRVVELQFGTGWYLWMILAAGGMALGPHRRILAPLAIYFLVLGLTVDSRSVYGWYRLPFYPFLCLAGGKFLAEWWEEKDLSRAFVFSVTALATTFYHVLPAAAERSRTAVGTIFVLCCVAPFAGLLFPSGSGRRWRAVAAALSMAVFFCGNLFIVNRQVSVYLQEAARSKVPGVAGAAPAGGDTGSAYREDSASRPRAGPGGD
jgi:hypothetical protein